jgi:hypothetical protein
MVTDTDLLLSIKEDLSSSPFRGEGHRKVHARLKSSPYAVFAYIISDIAVSCES